jgi:integrase
MVYLGQAGSPESHERYRRVVAEWLATGRVPRRGDVRGQRKGATVAEVIEAYLRWARSYYLDVEGRPSPGLGPAEAAATPLRELYGATAASEFGPVALRAVRQVMIESGLCRNVVNQRVGRVKGMFRWAVAEELVPASVLTALSAVDPLRKGRSGARETEPVRPVPDEHVDAVLPFLPPTLRAMVRLQRLTGMRSGEVCVLRTRDVDTSGDVWLYRPGSHKTAYRGHERVVRIGPQAKAVLGPFMRSDQPAAFVFTPQRACAERRAERRDPSILQTAACRGGGRGSDATGRRYNPRSYRRALSYAMGAASGAGVLAVGDFWHPHQLRHRHATAVRQARGLDAARVLLGHRTLAQTLEYAEADETLASAVALELG